MKANMTRPNIIDNARGDVHEIGQSERGKKKTCCQEGHSAPQ